MRSCSRAGAWASYRCLAIYDPGPRPDGSYEHLWHGEYVSPDEVAFEPGVFLVGRAKALALQQARVVTPPPAPNPEPEPEPGAQSVRESGDSLAPAPQAGGDGGTVDPPPPRTARTLRLNGSVPADTWNRIGTRLIPKLRSGDQVDIQLAVSVSVAGSQAEHLAAELRQILEDLGLGVRCGWSEGGKEKGKRQKGKAKVGSVGDWVIG